MCYSCIPCLHPFSVPTLFLSTVDLYACNVYNSRSQLEATNIGATWSWDYTQSGTQSGICYTVECKSHLIYAAKQWIYFRMESSKVPSFS